MGSRCGPSGAGSEGQGQQGVAEAVLWSTLFSAPCCTAPPPNGSPHFLYRPAGRCSLRFVPTAVLSRQTAGLRGKSLIINLPGKPKSIRETIDEVGPAGKAPASLRILPVAQCAGFVDCPACRNSDKLHSGGTTTATPLPRSDPSPMPGRPCLQIFASIPACIDLLEGPYIETHEAVVKAFRPPALRRTARPTPTAQ